MGNTIDKTNICGLRSEDFEATINGKETSLYILRNSSGCELAITNYGGAICALMVPDKFGNMGNIVQGYGNIQDLQHAPAPYLSTLIGRYGNRICRGRFVLNGKEYQLAINNGVNTLHGGPTGFHTRVWDARQMGPNSLALHRVSSYGEEGFSGELDVTVEITLTDDNELILEHLATTNKKTIINLTHHAFFSLQGTADPTPSIDSQVLQINADYYLPTDDTAIPTGEVLKVEHTPFDFRTPQVIGSVINASHEQIKIGNGFDHCYVLNKHEEGELSFAARLYDPHSGRVLDCYTTEPGMQFYSGNYLNGDFKGAGGATFPYRSAVCLECQHFPDTPNHPYFPSVILQPGQQYTQKTIYKFTLKA